MTGSEPIPSSAEPLPVTLQERIELLKARNPATHTSGPISDFETLGRHQLEVLIHEGLAPHSTVLDIGCGCLRAGYWIMSFVEPGHYFGVEPNRESVMAGLEYIVGSDVAALARPRFDFNGDFDFSSFGVEFDVLVARSIWTHASKAQIQTMLDGFAQLAAPGGVMLVSYLPASRLPEPIRSPMMRVMTRIPRARRAFRRVVGRRPRMPAYEGDAWSAPLVAHSASWIEEACAARGLVVRPLPYGVLNSQVWLRIERAGSRG